MRHWNRHIILIVQVDVNEKIGRIAKVVSHGIDSSTLEKRPRCGADGADATNQRSLNQRATPDEWYLHG